MAGEPIKITVDGKVIEARQGEMIIAAAERGGTYIPRFCWPPQKTTICVLGPSIPSSITSAIKMFRDEFLVHIKEGACPFGG